MPIFWKTLAMISLLLQFGHLKCSTPEAIANDWTHSLKYRSMIREGLEHCLSQEGDVTCGDVDHSRELEDEARAPGRSAPPWKRSATVFLSLEKKNNSVLELGKEVQECSTTWKRSARTNFQLANLLIADDTLYVWRMRQAFNLKINQMKCN